MKQNFTQLQKKYLNAFILAMVCIAIMQNTNAQVCANQNNIFGVTGNGAIYPVDITNANAGSQINTAAYSGASPNQSNAIGYNTVNGKFYYFKVNPGVGGQEFVSYNPTTNTYAALATSPIAATVHAGCVSFNGTGYYCTDVNGNLFFYNITLNTWTTITSSIFDQYGNSVSSVIQTQNSGDMAIDGLGNLWLVTSSTANYALYKIPTPLPTTAQGSVTAKMIIASTTAVPAGSKGFQGIAFNAAGALFLSTGSSWLYKLSNTSTLSLIGTLSVSGVGNDLTSCSFPFGILPITWASFNARLNNNQVNISWSVADANNIKGFYVERSTDNKNWDVLTYVDYSEDKADYSFVDASPASGNNYYRIHEVDYNNADNYSSIEMVSVSSSTKISVWPNPSSDIVHVQADELTDYSRAQIFDQLGRVVSSSLLHQGNNRINVSTLPTGNYVLHIIAKDGAIYNQKIIKK
jgi:hypothetical protein